MEFYWHNTQLIICIFSNIESIYSTNTIIFSVNSIKFGQRLNLICNTNISLAGIYHRDVHKETKIKNKK